MSERSNKQPWRKERGTKRRIDDEGEVPAVTAVTPDIPHIQEEPFTAFETPQERMERAFLKVAREAYRELRGHKPTTVWSNFNGNLPYSDKKHLANIYKHFTDSAIAKEGFTESQMLQEHIKRNAELRAQEQIRAELKFPKIGLDYSGPITEEIIEQIVVPRVAEALKASGHSEKEAQALITTSIREIFKGKNSSHVISHLMRVLGNIEHSIGRRSVVTKEKSAPTGSNREKSENRNEFEQLRNRLDINKGAGWWYKKNTHSNLDYIKVFRKIKYGFNLNTKLSEEMMHIVALQVSFQELLAQADIQGIENLSDQQFQELKENALLLEKLKKEFDGSKDLETTTDAVTEGSELAESQDELNEMKEAINKTEEEEAQNGEDKAFIEEEEIQNAKVSVLKEDAESKPEIASSPESQRPSTPDELTPEPSGPIPLEKKEYEKRSEMSRAWRIKRDQYQFEYKKYFEALAKEKKERGVFKKMQFWKKDELPASLLQLQSEYQNARRQYASVLETALSTSRFVEKAGDAKKVTESLRAGLANRFVLRAAHDKLQIERQFVPTGKAERVLEGMKDVFKKHGKKIATASMLWTIGTGVVTGGLFGAAQAIGGKALAAKLSAGGAFAGAAAGGYIGTSIVYNRERKRNRASSKAVKSFSAESIEALEDNYAKNYKAYENAARNQKYWVAGGAVLGGLAGSAVAGRIDADSLIENMPDLPDGSIEASGNAGGPTEVRGAVELKNIPDNAPSGSIEASGNVEATTRISGAVELTNIPDATPSGSVEASGNAGTATEVRGAVELKNIPDNASIGSIEVSGNTGGPTEIKGAVELTNTPDDEPNVSSGSIEASGNIGAGTEVRGSVELHDIAETPETPEILYTFEPGDKVDTVSEALFEEWKADHDLVEGDLSKKEFLAQMYAAIAELEKNPSANAELLDQMGITSGDIDKVQVGQTIDLQPFYEYLNERK